MAVKVDINLDLKGTEKSDALLKRMTDTLQIQRRELEALNKAGRLEGLQQGEKEVNDLTRRLAAMANEMQRGSSESDQLVASLRDVAKAADLVEEKAENAGRAVRNMPTGGAQKSVFYAGSGTVGDTAGDVGTISSNLAGLTGNQNFAVAGGLGDVIEGTLRLRASAEELFQSMSGGIASVAAAAAPFVVAGAAVVGTFVAMKEITEAQREVATDAVRAEQKRTDALIAQREAVLNLTSAEIERQKKTLEFELAALQQQKDNIEKARQEQRENQSAVEAAAFGSGIDRINALAKESDSLFGNIVDSVVPDSLVGTDTEFSNQLIALDDQIASVTGRINDLGDAFDERAPIDNLIGRLERTNELEEERARLLKEGTTEGLREQAIELQREIDQRLENIAAAREARNETEKDSAAFQLLSDYIAENIQANLENARTLQLVTGAATDAARAREAEALAAERAARAVERAKEAFDEAAAEFERLRDEAAKAGQEVVKAQTDVLKAENAIADVQAKRAEDDARREDRARQENAILDQIDAAKKVAAATKTADNLNRIRSEGYTKEQQITANYLSESAKALQDYNESVSDLNKEFATSELRATEDYNLARFRLARDLEAGLFEAARANDVSSFITQRNRGVTQLGDQAVDFGIDRRRAGEDQGARLADLREGLQREQAERAQASQVSIAQTRAEVTERIATEQAGGVARITQEQVLQQQLVDLRAAFAREDERMRREEQDAQLRDNIANAKIRYGIAKQTEALLYNQAAAAGQNIGIIMINSAVSAVNQYRNLITSAMLGGAGSTFNSFSFGNITVGNGMNQNAVQQEVQQGVQASINQLAKAGQFIFSRR